MASRAALAALVVCLVAAPGCSVFGGSDAGSVETLTPVPVTADEQTPTRTPDSPSGSLPPGVWANGTVDVDRLVAAHESSLANHTYRWEFSYGVAGEGGPYATNVTWETRVGSDEFLVNQTSSELPASESLFVVDGTGYLRSVTSQNVRFQTIPRPGDHYSLAFSGAVLERFLTGVTVDVTTVQVGGQTYYRLYAADGEMPPQLQRETSTVQDYTVTAYVTPEGFVRTLVVDYDHLDTEEFRHVRARYDYTAVGSATVDRPVWVARVTPAPPATTPQSPTRGTTPQSNGTATPATASAGDEEATAPAVHRDSAVGVRTAFPVRCLHPSRSVRSTTD